MVSAHLKNISQIGNLPQIGVKIKNISNHQPDNKKAWLIYVNRKEHGDSTALRFLSPKEPGEPSAWRQQEPNFDASAARSIVAFGYMVVLVNLSYFTNLDFPPKYIWWMISLPQLHFEILGAQGPVFPVAMTFDQIDVLDSSTFKGYP